VNPRARMILAIVATVVVVALFFFLFIRSRQSNLAQIRSDIEAEENTSIQLTTELNRLKDLQERAPQLQAELAEIKQFVPENHEIPNFIFLVQDSATAAGVDFLSMAPELPKVPPEQAPLAEVRITIQAKGGYFSLQDFIRRLHNLDRAVRIDSLTMAEASEEGGPVEIAMEILARVFFELPAEAPPDPGGRGKRCACTGRKSGTGDLAVK
jgi:Tfp pilus assembly protein PilO